MTHAGAPGKIFREEWVQRRTAAAGPGRLVRHARWTGWLWGAVVAATAAAVLAGQLLQIPRSIAVPATVVGITVIARLDTGRPPAVGVPVVFRPSGGGAEVRGHVIATAAGGFHALLSDPPAARSGTLVIQMGTERLVDLLLPGSVTPP